MMILLLLSIRNLGDGCSFQVHEPIITALPEFFRSCSSEASIFNSI